MNILLTRICFDLLKIITKFLSCLYQNTKIESEMTYSESEPDLNFAINSASNFVPTFSESKSEPESESDFSSVFINLDICIYFTLYLHFSK